MQQPDSVSEVEWLDWVTDDDGTFHLTIGPWAFSVGPAIQVEGIAISWGERVGERTAFEMGFVRR